MQGPLSMGPSRLLWLHPTKWVLGLGLVGLLMGLVVVGPQRSFTQLHVFKNFVWIGYEQSYTCGDCCERRPILCLKQQSLIESEAPRLDLDLKGKAEQHQDGNVFLLLLGSPAPWASLRI